MNTNGFVTLISIVVIGAVSVAISVALIMLGLSTSRTSFAEEQSAQARHLADACTEEALQQIHDSVSFAGSGALTFGNDSCTYTVTSAGGQARTVTASGTVGTIVRRVQVLVTKITPSITLSSWQEVAN